MAAGEFDYPYEASDEASESELLDRSLSVWRGWSSLERREDFQPVPLDLHTASSIGQYDCVRSVIHRFVLLSCQFGTSMPMTILISGYGKFYSCCQFSFET